jgi:hypothetical protein
LNYICFGTVGGSGACGLRQASNQHVATHRSHASRFVKDCRIKGQNSRAVRGTGLDRTAEGTNSRHGESMIESYRCRHPPPLELAAGQVHPSGPRSRVVVGSPIARALLHLSSVWSKLSVGRPVPSLLLHASTSCWFSGRSSRSGDFVFAPRLPCAPRSASLSSRLAYRRKVRRAMGRHSSD